MAQACPKCGSTKIEGDECLHCGIYISKYLAYLAKRAAPATPAGATAAVGTSVATGAAGVASDSMDEVDFKLFGDDIQFVEIELDPGEAAVAEPGAMLYMESDITMETS